MLKYLGEIDCIEDLIDMVGEDAGNKAWHGKLNYFKDISSGNIFGVSDFQADYIFEIGDLKHGLLYFLTRKLQTVL